MAIQPTSIHTSLEKVVEAIGDTKLEPWSKFSGANQREGLTADDGETPGHQKTSNSFADELQKLIQQEAQRRKDQQNHSGTSGFFDRKKSEETNRFKSLREAQEQMKIAQENLQYKQKNVIPPGTFKDVAFDLGMYVPRSRDEHFSLLPKTFQPSEYEPRSVLHSMLGLIGGYSSSPLRKRHRHHQQQQQHTDGVAAASSSPTMTTKALSGPENLARLCESFGAAALRCHVIRQRAINAGIDEDMINESAALLQTLNTQIDAEVENLKKTMSKDHIAELPIDRVTFRETLDSFLFERSIVDYQNQQKMIAMGIPATQVMNNSNNNNLSSLLSPSASNQFTNNINNNTSIFSAPSSNEFRSNAANSLARKHAKNNNVGFGFSPTQIALNKQNLSMLSSSINGNLLLNSNNDYKFTPDATITNPSSPFLSNNMTIGRSAVGSILTKLQKKMDTSIDEPDRPFELMDPETRILAYDAVFDSIDIRRSGDISWSSFFATITQASLLPKLGGLVHHPRNVDFSHWILPTKMREIFGNVHHVSTYSKGDAQIICANDAACIVHLPRKQDHHHIQSSQNHHQGQQNYMHLLTDEEKCDIFFSSLKYIVTYEFVRCFVNGRSVAINKNRPVESFAEKLRKQKQQQKEADARRMRRLQGGDVNNDNDNDNSNTDNGERKPLSNTRSKKEDENLVYGDRLTALAQPKKTREPPPQVVQVLVIERVQTIIVSSTDGTVKFFQIAGSQSLPHCELFFTVHCDNTISCICPAWDYETLFFGTRQGHILCIDFPLPQKNLSSKSLRIHCMNVPSRRTSSVVAKMPSLLRSKRPPANSSKVPTSSFHCYVKDKTDEELAQIAFRAIETYDVTFRAQALPHSGIVSFIIHLEVEKAVLSCSYDHTIVLSNEHSLEPLVRYHGHTSGVHKAVHSDDYNFFVSIAFDSKPLVWSVSTAPSRKPPMELYDNASPHQGTVVDVDYIPSSNIVITLDDEGVVKFWDMRLIHCFDSFHASKHQPSIMGTFNAESGSNVNEKFKDDIDLAKIMSMPLRFVGMSLMYEPSSLTSPTETLRIFIFSQYHGAAVCEWNLRLKERVVKNAAEDQPILASFALNDDPAYQIVGNITPEHYRTWDVPSGHIRDMFVNEHHGHAGGISVACINKVKTVIAIGTRDGSIFVHNANTNSLIQGFRNVFGGSGDEELNLRRRKIAQRRENKYRNNFAEKFQGGSNNNKNSSSAVVNPVSQICCFSHAPQFHLKHNAPRIMVMSLCLSLNQLHLVNLDPTAAGSIVEDSFFHASKQSVNSNKQGKKYGKGALLSAALATAALEKGVYLELLDEFEQNNDSDSSSSSSSSDSTDDQNEFSLNNTNDGNATSYDLASPIRQMMNNSTNNNTNNESSFVTEQQGTPTRKKVATFLLGGDDEKELLSKQKRENTKSSPTKTANRIAREYAKSGIEHTVRCFDVEQNIDLVVVGTSHAKIIGFSLSNVCSTAALRIPVGTLLLPPPSSTISSNKNSKNQQQNELNTSAAGEEEIQRKVSTGDLDPILVKVVDEINCGVAATESGRICLFSLGCPTYNNNRDDSNNNNNHFTPTSPRRNFDGSIWSVGRHQQEPSSFTTNDDDGNDDDQASWTLTSVNITPTTPQKKTNNKPKKLKKKQLPNHFSPLACWYHTNETQFSATQSPLPTIVTYPDRLPHMLYVGDDKGFITIYDILPILNDGAEAPRVVNRWLAHNFEPVSSILFLSTKDHPETVCCTAGGDQGFHAFSMSGSLYFGSLDLHQRLSVLSVPHFVSDDLDTFDSEKHLQRLRNAPGAQLLMSKKDIYEMASELVENEAKDRAIQLVSEGLLDQQYQQQQQQNSFGDTFSDDRNENEQSLHAHFAQQQQQEDTSPSISKEEHEHEKRIHHHDSSSSTAAVDHFTKTLLSQSQHGHSNDDDDEAEEEEEEEQEEAQNINNTLPSTTGDSKSISDQLFEKKIAALNPNDLSKKSKENNENNKKKKGRKNKKNKSVQDDSTIEEQASVVTFPGHHHHVSGSATTTSAQTFSHNNNNNNFNSNLYASGAYASFGSASPIIHKVDAATNPYNDEIWKEAAVRLVMEALRRTLLVPRCRWITPLKTVYWSKKAYNENTDDALQIVQSLVLSNKNANQDNEDDGKHEDEINSLNDFDLNHENSKNQQDHNNDINNEESNLLAEVASWEQQSTTSSKTPTFQESLQMLTQQQQEEMKMKGAAAGAATLGMSLVARNDDEKRKHHLAEVTRKPPATRTNMNTLSEQHSINQRNESTSAENHAIISSVATTTTTGEAARTGGNGLFYRAAPNLSRRPPSAPTKAGEKRQSVLDYAESRWGDAATSRFLYVNVENNKLDKMQQELLMKANGEKQQKQHQQEVEQQNNNAEDRITLPMALTAKHNDVQDQHQQQILNLSVLSNSESSTFFSTHLQEAATATATTVQNTASNTHKNSSNNELTKEDIAMGLSPLNTIVQVPNIAVNSPLLYDDFTTTSSSFEKPAKSFTASSLAAKNTKHSNQKKNEKATPKSNNSPVVGLPKSSTRPSSASITHRGIISSPSSVLTSGRSQKFSQSFSKKEILIATGKEKEFYEQQQQAEILERNNKQRREEEQEKEYVPDVSVVMMSQNTSNRRALPEAQAEIQRAQMTRKIFASIEASPIRRREKEDEDAKLFGSGKKIVKGLVIHKNTNPPGLLETSPQRQRHVFEMEKERQQHQKQQKEHEHENENENEKDKNNHLGGDEIILRPESRALLSKFSKLHSVAKLRQHGFSSNQNNHSSSQGAATPQPKRSSSSSSLLLLRSTPPPGGHSRK